jgi:hypothetical protein
MDRSIRRARPGTVSAHGMAARHVPFASPDHHRCRSDPNSAGSTHSPRAELPAPAPPPPSFRNRSLCMHTTLSPTRAVHVAVDRKNSRFGCHHKAAFFYYFRAHHPFRARPLPIGMRELTHQPPPSYRPPLMYSAEPRNVAANQLGFCPFWPSRMPPTLASVLRPVLFLEGNGRR